MLQHCIAVFWLIIAVQVSLSIVECKTHRMKFDYSTNTKLKLVMPKWVRHACVLFAQFEN